MSVTVINGDALSVLATLPSCSVQTCVTSPPYFGLRSYLPDTHPDKSLEIGTESTPDEYVAKLVDVFWEVRRVLRDDGTLWLNIGDCYGHGTSAPGKRNKRDGYDKGKESSSTTDNCRNGLLAKQLIGIPWRVAFALQACGWYLRSSIVWAKPNPMPESVTDRPTNSYEMVFLLAKRASYFYDADAIREPWADDRNGFSGAKSSKFADCADRNDGGIVQESDATGRNCRNVWTINSQPFSGAHFATMPPELAERCIRAGTSERGCCPSCGAPWERVIEHGASDLKHQRACGGDATGKYNGTSTKNHVAAGVQDASAVKARILAGMVAKTTTGWQSTCKCPEHTPVMQTVLDPFAGAGTTGLVADRLGRNAVLIDLHSDFTAMAKDRIHSDCPLFSGISA